MTVLKMSKLQVLADNHLSTPHRVLGFLNFLAIFYFPRDHLRAGVERISSNTAKSSPLAFIRRAAMNRSS
jgi:hypothetical protein